MPEKGIPIFLRDHLLHLHEDGFAPLFFDSPDYRFGHFKDMAIHRIKKNKNFQLMHVFS